MGIPTRQGILSAERKSFASSQLAHQQSPRMSLTRTTRPPLAPDSPVGHRDSSATLVGAVCTETISSYQFGRRRNCLLLILREPSAYHCPAGPRPSVIRRDREVVVGWKQSFAGYPSSPQTISHNEYRSHTNHPPSSTPRSTTLPKRISELTWGASFSHRRNNSADPIFVADWVSPRKIRRLTTLMPCTLAAHDSGKRPTGARSSNQPTAPRPS